MFDDAEFYFPDGDAGTRTSSGGTVTLRMNVTVHFKAERLIDRFFTYYDRTKIIQATGTNILAR